MTKPRSVALDPHHFRDWRDHWERLFAMSKKYELVRDKLPRPGGGFVEAFRMALVDLSNFGERHLDLTGYPHESASHALASDWSALGADFQRAVIEVEAEAAMTEHELSDATGGTQGQKLGGQPAETS